MTSTNQLAEMRMREYVARQQRQDELDADDCAHHNDCRGQDKPTANTWRQRAISNAGPLCLLDAVGQAEESWLELIEQAPRCELPQPAPPSLELQPAY